MKQIFSKTLSSSTKVHIVILLIIMCIILAHAKPFPFYSDASNLYENSTPYDLSEETYTFSEVWSTPAEANINFLSGNSPICTREGITFVLYVDTVDRIKIAKIDGATVTEAFIDTHLYSPDDFYVNSDDDITNDRTEADYYRIRHDDAHHAISIGIDEEGYLHIVGDMHNYPRYMGPQEHLPLKYVNQNVLYWRSDAPFDITGFTFLGDQIEKGPQGTGFTYQYFFNDMDGKLFMSSRGQQKNGVRCGLYNSYNSSTGEWSILGDTIAGEPDHPRTFYDDGFEYNAGDVSGTYNKTQPVGVFDRQNRLHMVAAMLDNPTLNPWGSGNGVHFANTIAYAQSSDGIDFYKANGSEIILPATIDLTSNQADIAYTKDGYLASNGVVAVDYQNRPYTVVREMFYDGSPSVASLIGWDGSSWKNYGEPATKSDKVHLIHDPAGVMSYVLPGFRRIYRFWNPTDTLLEIKTPWAINTIDKEYLKATGNIMGLAKVDDKLTVVKVEIKNRAIDATHMLQIPNQKASLQTFTGDENIAIYSLNGRLIYSTKLSYKSINSFIKSRNLSSGIYFLQTQSLRHKFLVR